MTTLDIGPLRDEDEHRQFVAVMNDALRMHRLAQIDWLPRYPSDAVRVVRVGGQVVACATLLSMGQWFGGKSVPLIGVHAVGVLPEYRSRQVGRALMRAIVEEIHQRGVPLSGLYPTTLPVYRHAGYEQAGSWIRYVMTTESLHLRSSAPAVRGDAAADAGAKTGQDTELEIGRLGPVQNEDQLTAAITRLQPVYDQRARHEAGHLDRSRWAWQRILWPLYHEAHTFYAHHGEHIEGYITFTQNGQQGSLFYDFDCRDLVALTPRALRCLLGFVASHRSVAPTLYITAGSATPLHMILREQRLQVKEQLFWLTRIIDVQGALAARGYPAALDTTVRFAVRDDILGHNSRAYILRVAEGRGEVTAETGAAAPVELDIRGLAALYTGHASGAQLAAAGLARGAPAELAALSAVFAGPAPWMSEIY